MVILGHSERRARLKTSEKLLHTVAAVLETGMFPLVCVGETKKQRESGKAFDVVAGQLRPLLTGGLDLGGIVIAYEPVWAIGTGLSASRKDIEEIRDSPRGNKQRQYSGVIWGQCVS